MSHFYTGVGSRSTPPAAQQLLKEIASTLESLGYILRSGASDGADAAFETGVNAEAHKEIYLPWQRYNNSSSNIYTITQEALKLASGLCSYWENVSPAGKLFHARNCYQVLGHNLDTPSLFLICWTPEGTTIGGTATSIKLATRHQIPVFNLGHPKYATHQAIDIVREVLNVIGETGEGP
jgi:hypothetical protein